MKFKIVHIDMDDFNGRENHPEKSDVGLVVTPLSMETVWTEPDSCREHNVPSDYCTDEENKAHALDYENLLAVWNCITADGRYLQLMDFEVEALSDRCTSPCVDNYCPVHGIAATRK